MQLGPVRAASGGPYGYLDGKVCLNIKIMKIAKVGNGERVHWIGSDGRPLCECDQWNLGMDIQFTLHLSVDCKNCLGIMEQREKPRKKLSAREHKKVREWEEWTHKHEGFRQS